MRSCIFIIITPVFSVTWSSEIIIIYWFTAQETFLIIIIVLHNILWIHFIITDEYKSLKEINVFEIEIICDIINVFTANFDQSNAFLLKENIMLFQ